MNENLERLVARALQAKFSILSKQAHNIMLESPGELAGIIDSWITEDLRLP